MKFRNAFFALGVTVALVTASRSDAQVTHNSATVSWTTPGDDGTIGTASQFDLRYSTSPITLSNFDNASRYTLTPSPTAPGTRQSVTVTGLLPLTLYYFAIKTADEVPNWSPISNVLQVTTTAAPDNMRPAPLAISVTTATDTTVTLGWAAVGDDSLTGTATSYDIRYSTSAITASNWASATQATGEPTPAVSGTPQSFVVRNLNRQATYYFAARATDDVGNISAMSNVPIVTTPDTVPPASITDLAVGWLFFGWHGMAAVREHGTGTR